MPADIDVTTIPGLLLPSEDDDGSAAEIARWKSEYETAIRSWKADVAALRAERDEARATCNGSCDIALARRQVGPDGVVPGNARECAEMWEREAARITTDWKRVAAKAMEWGRERDTAIRERDFAINCIGELTAERDEARSSLAAALVRVEAAEQGRDLLEAEAFERGVKASRYRAEHEAKTSDAALLSAHMAWEMERNSPRTVTRDDFEVMCDVLDRHNSSADVLPNILRSLGIQVTPDEAKEGT